MESLLEWGGAILSLLGTGITIRQVYKAKSIKNEIISERKKITYQNIIEELKKAQPHIRQIMNKERGVKPHVISELIQSSFDSTISSLDDNNENEKEIRKLLQKAQKKLNEFLNDPSSISHIETCRIAVQDSISKTTTLLKGD